MWSVVFALATFHDYLYGYTEIVQTYHRPVSQHRLISYRAGAWHYRIFPDSKRLPKQRVKQRSLRAVETILRARLLQKVNILKLRTVVLLL